MTYADKRLAALQRMAARFVEPWKSDSLGYIRNSDFEPIAKARDAETAAFIVAMQREILPLINRIVMFKRGAQDLAE